MKQVYCLIILTLSLQIVNGQSATDTALVRKSMEAYIDAFYQGDSLKIVDHISPQVVKYGYYKPKDSIRYAGEPMSFQEMINYTLSVKKRNRKLPENTVRKVEIFDVQDQTASGKVTAWWGTDYILLARENEKWMIRLILWQSPPKR